MSEQQDSHLENPSPDRRPGDGPPTALPDGASSASYPRDQRAVMESDWFAVLATLRMLQDRALTGTPLHLMRPSWFPPTGDYLSTMRGGVIKLIKDIFSTAIVDGQHED